MIDFIKSGKWGISHGLISSAVIGATWFLTASPIAVILISVLTAAYWTRREAVARRTWNVTTWYLDSQLDAAVPIVVSLVSIFGVLQYA